MARAYLESVRQIGRVMITTINLSVGVVAMAMGIFVAAAPARAAGIWASKRLERDQPSVLRWFRVFGIILCLGGALFALDSIGFWNYRR